METGEKGGDKNARKKSLASVPKIDRLKMSDGEEYDMVPLNMSMLIEFEEEFDGSAMGLLETGRLKYVRYLLYLRLKPNYPDMTVEKAGKLVDFDVIDKVLTMMRS